MHFQDENSSQWREKEAMGFVQRIFANFQRHTEIPPMSKKMMFKNILVILEGKNNSVQLKNSSFASSQGSDMFKDSSKGQMKAMARALRQVIPYSNQHILIQEMSSQNKKEARIVKIQTISERNQRSPFLGNVSSIDQQTQKHLKSESQNSLKISLMELECSSNRKLGYRTHKKHSRKNRSAISSKKRLRQRKIKLNYSEQASFSLKKHFQPESSSFLQVSKNKIISKQPLPKNKKKARKNRNDNPEDQNFKQERGRRPMDPQMQFKLVSWIKQQETIGVKVPQTKIREKAWELSSKPNFRASKGWLQKFLKRNRAEISVGQEKEYQILTRQMIQDAISKV